MINRMPGSSGSAGVWRRAVVSQFRAPKGLPGALAGWIMAHRASNVQRNDWTISLLALAPDANVLEIGCGPGIGLAALFRRHPEATAVGVDISKVMIGQAARRNRQALAADRLTLWHGSLDTLPEAKRTFDAIYSCNVVQFVEDRSSLLRRVKDLLRPGGVVATTFQPRGPCADAETGRAWIGQLAEDLAQAGFERIEVFELSLQPVPAFCAIGLAPEAGRQPQAVSAPAPTE